MKRTINHKRGKVYCEFQGNLVLYVYKQRIIIRVDKENNFLRCPDYEFGCKNFPSRTVIFIILVNGDDLTPAPLEHPKKNFSYSEFFTISVLATYN